jgi:NADPH-dependent curcumin reductase CurA
LPGIFWILSFFIAQAKSSNEIAKLKGCRVIGIAGSHEKCQVLAKLGVDVTLNYNQPNFPEEMARAAGTKGIDVYYDNTGGDIFRVCFGLMGNYGRIVICGGVSGYDGTQSERDKLALTRSELESMIFNRLEIKGLRVSDFRSQFPSALKELHGWVAEGKLTTLRTVESVHFGDVPKVWATLFEGRNTGKLITKLIV